MNITPERIERLKGQVPPGWDADFWAFIVDYHGYAKVDAVDNAKYVKDYWLRLMIADADAREAGPISEDFLESLAEIKCNAELWIDFDDAKAILARAGLGVGRAEPKPPARDPKFAPECLQRTASAKPLDMNVSEEWLLKMADAEDGGCTSVGGLAVELGLLGSKPKDVPVGIVDALRAVIEAKRHIERAMGEYVQDTIDGLGNRGQSGDSR